MAKFKIRDYVKIIDDSFIYPNYREWKEKYKLDNWAMGKEPIRYIPYIIVAMGPHLRNSNTFLYGIQDANKNQFIIREEGLKGQWEDQITTEVTNIKDKYPNKCPMCQSPSYNNTFFMAVVECTNKSCKHYKK